MYRLRQCNAGPIPDVSTDISISQRPLSGAQPQSLYLTFLVVNTEMVDPLPDVDEVLKSFSLLVYDSDSATYLVGLLPRACRPRIQRGPECHGVLVISVLECRAGRCAHEHLSPAVSKVLSVRRTVG